MHIVLNLVSDTRTLMMVLPWVRFSHPSCPLAKITVLVQPEHVWLAGHAKGVDHALAWDDKDVMQAFGEGIDVWINMSRHQPSIQLGVDLGAKARLGYRYGPKHWGKCSTYLSLPRRRSDRHETLNVFAWWKTLGCTHLKSWSELKGMWAPISGQLIPKEAGYRVLISCALWPPSKIEALCALMSKKGWDVVIDGHLTQYVSSRYPRQMICTDSSLGADALCSFDLVISDGDLAYVASALSIQVVMLMAHDMVHRWHPLGPFVQILSASVLAGVSVQRVCSVAMYLSKQKRFEVLALQIESER